MSFRELIILLLGLAIVAVILRGLYVAIQARKGQIKLAIDKNIPQDVDLDALELAELPGGGARVVQRDTDAEASNDYLDPIEQANARAESIALDRDAQTVPVLMDSVTLSQNELDLDEQEESAVDEYANDSDEFDTDDDFEKEFEEDYEDRQPSIGIEALAPDYDDEDSEEHDREDSFEEDADYGSADAESDDILLDYEANDSDGMASVQPDYPDAEDSESYSDEYAEDAAAESDEYEEHTEYEDYEVAEEQEDTRGEPGFDPAAVDSLDDFSMTAGERIGYHNSPSTESATQTLANAESEPEVPVKRTSLFAALRNKISQSLATRAEDDADDLSDAEIDAFAEDNVESTESPDAYTEYDEYEDYDEHQQGGDSDVYEPELESDPVQQDFVDEDSGAEAEYERPLSATTTDIRQHQAAGQPTEVKQQSGNGQPSEVLVLNVMARDGRAFHGDALMHAVITHGLKFGEMNIFHYRFKNHSKGPVIFSLANILNPGTFDLNNMSDFSTIGVSLFLALPAAGSNYEAFEQMLDIAQQLCATLDGELKDDHRNVMTAQTIEHYRQRVRDFELRQLKAAGARG